MRGRLIALLAAALLVVGLLAMPGLATYTDTDTDTDSSSSEAEISVVDCVVESTKDISYVAFLDSGEELDRFNVNAPTYDLTGYSDIHSVDSVRVKSGETVESFGVDCGEKANPDEEPTEDPTEDPTEEPTDKPTEDDDEDKGTVESHNDKAGANSQAVITVNGCTVNSSKDISYIAFLTDGEQVDKIEGVDSESYNLNSYGDIDDIDAIRVKAGTTVASFNVSCGTANTDEEPVKEDDSKSDDHHDDDAKDDTWDEHDDAKEEDSTSDEHDDDSDWDDDHAETDGEWDARHDGRHEHKDHEEIDHEDR